MSSNVRSHFDGIVQRVFTKYYTGGFEVDIDDNTVNVIPQSTLEDAFKELIVEIKKNAHDVDFQRNILYLHELIGKQNDGDLK